VPSATLTYLIGRLEDLERYAAKVRENLLRDDLRALTDETLLYVAKSLDLRDLNARLEAIAVLDVAALQNAVGILQATDLDGPLALSAETTLQPPDVVADLAQAVDNLAEHFAEMDELGLAVTIDFKVGRRFDDALMCAANAGAEVNDLLALARDKISLLNDEQLSGVWNRVQREFDPDRLHRMQDPESILPENFLRFDSTENVRDKVARYLVQLRPRLILAMSRIGQTTIPVEAIPLSRVLSWQSAEASEPVSAQEELLAQSLARLASLYTRFFYKDIAEVVSLLRVPAGSRILSGPEFKKAEVEFGQQGGPSREAVFFELRKIARIVDSVVTYESSVERALRQYKLGLEVMTPEILKSFDGKGELLLQKELCRFLLERNIFAVGTKFGRSETDLMTEEIGERYILETKLFRPQVSLRPAAIKHALVQLQTYLDQSPSTSRGILVIFNLTTSLLTAARKWIRGRYWILPINLQIEPPSGRKRSLAIEPSEDDQFIEITVIEHTRKPASRRKAKKKVAKKVTKRVRRKKIAKRRRGRR
jgi:hypothetical protein